MAKYLLTKLTSALLVKLSLTSPVESHSPSLANPDHVFTLAGQHTSFHALKPRFSSSESDPMGIDMAMPADNKPGYLLNVTAGGNNYSLLIDTGSCDTWFAKPGFRCYDDSWSEEVPFE